MVDLAEAHKAMRRKIMVRFRFARMPLTDPLDTARMDQVYASLGAMTPNELREQIGKPPFPEDFYFADKPFPIAMAELTAGLQLAIALNEEAAIPQQEDGDPAMSGKPDMDGPSGLPGAPGVFGSEDPLGAPFAEGIEVEGLAEGQGGAVTLGTRDKPEQARNAPTPLKLPQGRGFEIASEIMANARQFANNGAAMKSLLKNPSKDEGDSDG